MLPREILGKSTFELGVCLMKWMPIWVVDKILLAAARLVLGNIEKYGLKRPSIGPLELKNTQGKTPVLDIGTLSRIRSGEIKIVPGINKFLQGGVELVNGEVLEIDSVILATGYSSNVPSWLKVRMLYLCVCECVEVSFYLFVDSCDSYGSWLHSRFCFLNLVISQVVEISSSCKFFNVLIKIK